jgi:hypothetical protein
MRRLVLLTALLLWSSVFVLAQSGGDQTPPGGDMIGSDPHPAVGQLGQQSGDSEQNQRMTGTMGSTKGYAGDPAYAGSSEYLSTQTISTQGAVSEAEAAATAGRRRAENPQTSPYDTSASQPYLSGQFGQQKNGAPPAPANKPKPPAPPKKGAQ